MGDHATHGDGDANTHPDGRQGADEPSSYASMLAFSKEERDVIIVSAEEAIASTADR